MSKWLKSLIRIPADGLAFFISESGIKTANDAKYIYEKTGIKNFLIGESLLKSDNPDALMEKLIQITQ